MDKKNTGKELKRGSSFSINAATKEMLRIMADSEKRSMANMIEVLVEAEAKRRGIKLP